MTVHTGFFVQEITAEGLVSADGRKVQAEVIVNATGARPDGVCSSADAVQSGPLALTPVNADAPARVGSGCCG